MKSKSMNSKRVLKGVAATAGLVAVLLVPGCSSAVGGTGGSSGGLITVTI